jgi:hypothetical protein
MILPVQEELRAHIARLLTTLYSLDESSRPTVVLEYPPNRELGDLGTPVAFELARRVRKAPRAIAQEIAEAFGSLAGIRRVAAAPNGYLNFFLERRDFLVDRLTAGRLATTRAAAAKRSSSTRRSIPIRPRISDTCGMRRWETRSCVSSGSAAFLLKCRITSTTPAFRSPTSSSASARSKERD